MAYEFKKLSAVEAVDAVSDAASVLIEENGVIKRAPKSEVGGIKVASTAEVGQTIVVKAVDAAGNPTEWECADMSAGEPDLVVIITVSGELSEGTINDYGVANVTEVVGSVQTVLDKIFNGQDPSVIIKSSYIYGGVQWNGYVKNPVIIKKGDSILHVMWIQCSGYGHWYRHELEINNTNTPTYYWGSYQ